MAQLVSQRLVEHLLVILFGGQVQVCRVSKVVSRRPRSSFLTITPFCTVKLIFMAFHYPLQSYVRLFSQTVQHFGFLHSFLSDVRIMVCDEIDQVLVLLIHFVH